MDMDKRLELLQQLLVQRYRGEIHDGQMLRFLRKKLLKMNQTKYASLTGVSRRTLSAIENNTATPTMQVMAQIYRPLGMKVMLVPISPSLHQSMANELFQPDSD